MDIVIKVIIVLTVATVATPSKSTPAVHLPGVPTSSESDPQVSQQLNPQGTKGDSNYPQPHIPEHMIVEFLNPESTTSDPPIELKVVNPQDFTRFHESSNEAPVFSNTTPHVALTHIFCGQIARRNRAQGFHSRNVVDMNSAQPCARATGEITGENTNKCPFSAGGIEVLHRNGRYISRSANEQRPQTFFPDDWDPPFIVKLAQDIYHHCTGNSRLINGKACLKDYKFPDSDVCPQKTMNIKINVQRGIIISAYPIANLNGCDRTYTFPESYYDPIPTPDMYCRET